ncbi:spermidine/putrescine ABC transporter substrate-binding protein [Pontiellaceae bacterium B12219]|nr:spermidine/putrescine ABC transporter substrate-binding protein [Pontiellaceae bacterium B12219]
MKVTLSALAIGSMVALSATAKEELNIYIWTEYTEPELTKAFEEMYDCKVIESNYENCEEMVAKLQAGGVSQYDMVFPSDYIVPSMIELGLLSELDHSKIPNLGNLTDTFSSPSFDEGNKYSVAYQWGTVGLIYDSEKVTEPIDSWKPILESEGGTRFALFDSEREMTGIALTYLGYSMNTTNKKELMEAANLLIKAKKKKGYSGFVANVGGFSKVQAGTLDMSFCYSGDAFANIEESPNLKYVIPKEGTVVWCDSMCITKEAPNKELAYKYINFILDAKNGAQLSNYIAFATPNKASLPMIDKALLENPSVYPDAETEEKLEFILDAGANTAMYGELWKMIKTR